MELIEFTAATVRNIDVERLQFAAGANIVLGFNGVGKTSLLEAIFVLGNLRSFRSSSLLRVVRHGNSGFRVGGTIKSSEGSHHLEQIVEVGPPIRRTLRVDGSDVNVGQYLQFFPVVAISDADRELVGGGPESRRALLDRFVFLVRPAYLEELRSYRRAIRQRNAALTAGAGNAELAAWEEPLARTAGSVVAARARGAKVLAEYFSIIYEKLRGEDFPAIEPGYRTEPWLDPSAGRQKVEDLYQQRYNETRARDRLAGFTGDGPHRHDLSLRAAGRSIRYVVSSGQAKVVAAALRLATLAHVEKERHELFPVIVDDVDAELDSSALTRLVDHLGNERQIFLSSTNDEIAALFGSRSRRMWLDNGAIVRQEAEAND
jgi:DNA replication and repair protein RecF